MAMQNSRQGRPAQPRVVRQPIVSNLIPAHISRYILNVQAAQYQRLGKICQ
ncbi:hypothetical protein P692DRAFT_201871289 [Suillus brevipes Sb2]|nr:hypothetical protein P692DRAFT_201871289 [Suillus brevipes Sb2]